jgi:hypothetical protein
MLGFGFYRYIDQAVVEANMEPEIRDPNFYGEAEREWIPLVELVEKILQSLNIVEVWPEKNAKAA